METKPSADTPEAEAKASATFKYTFSGSVAQILAQSQASLWVSTYQVGKLAVFRVNREGKLSLLLRTFDKAMGMALSSKKLAIGTRQQIWSLNNETVLFFGDLGVRRCLLDEQAHLLDVVGREVRPQGKTNGVRRRLGNGDENAFELVGDNHFVRPDCMARLLQSSRSGSRKSGSVDLALWIDEPMLDA